MVDRLVNSEANSRRVGAVEQAFGVSGQPLAVHGRVLVGEGVLTKMCRKRPKPRQFFLFNDILVYGNIVINKKKYNKQHIIPLDDVKLESVEDDGTCRNGWMIKSPSKSFVVYAATATEKSEWMAHINKCVTDLLAKRGKTQTLEESPVWVPDSATNTCMHCKKTEFTFVQRRHHCRNCGKVVCGNCSNRKWLLPNQSSKSLRVCNTCYEKLNNGQPANSDYPGNGGKGEIRPISGNYSSGDSSSEDDDDVTVPSIAAAVNRNESSNTEEPTFYEGNQPVSKS